ncbi:2-amino-4-hydroxy-6-hydroxymethyldihydropteridine diphosphokinase [Streptococcus hongkongensis]|nr:2-amino-4-hydroxy-6-hydroxymethyldihydropteridine pyrophosphokinase [Streptococcus uberis]
MNKIYLSLGSNQGDSLTILTDAITLINKIPKSNVKKVSSFYRTPAWGKEDQEDFFNCAISVESELSAQDFLQETQAIEIELGRVRHEKWGPRTIDIDILLYNQEKIVTDTLTVPHPYMTKRAFVLVPLLEIAPHLQMVEQSLPLSDYLKKLDSSSILKVVE